MNKFVFFAVLLLLQGEASALTLVSKNFLDGGVVPQLITCDGSSVSPELSWSDVPHGTKSFVLIVNDPDVPVPGGFDHWVLFNLPHDSSELTQGITNFPKGTGFGQNGSKTTGYTPLCPPTGRHRYYFILYALDEKLKLPDGVTKSEILETMKDHALGKAELMGTYKKVNP